MLTDDGEPWQPTSTETMQLGMQHAEYDIRFAAQLCADEADTIEEEGAMVADYPNLVTKCDLYAEVVTLIVDSKL